MYSTDFNKIKFVDMADIGTFTEPKNKMAPLLPWEPWAPKFEVQKNDSLALIIEILYLRRISSHS